MHEAIETLFIICVTAIAIGVVGGCTTARGVDSAVLQHQQQIAELESRNTILEQRLAEYHRSLGESINRLVGIQERAAGMETNIDAIINEFAEYQREVELLIQRYNALQGSN